MEANGTECALPVILAPGVPLRREFMANIVSQPASRTVFVSTRPFEDERIAAAAIYCSDGRYGEHIDEFLHVGLGLPRYDRIALPGGAACLAGHVKGFHEKLSLERQLSFLIRAHALQKIVLIAHEGCAYYKDIWTAMQSTIEQQSEDLKRAAQHISLLNNRIEVATFFARNVDDKVAFERWGEVRP